MSSISLSADHGDATLVEQSLAGNRQAFGRIVAWIALLVLLTRPRVRR